MWGAVDSTQGVRFQVCTFTDVVRHAGNAAKTERRPLKRWCFNGPFRCIELFVLFGVGGFLLSHNLPVAVPSALAGLASGFGMGPGVSLLL